MTKSCNTLNFSLIILIVSNELVTLPAGPSQVSNHYMRFLTASMKHNSKHISNLTTSISNGSLNVEMWTIRDVVPGFRTTFNIQISLSDKKHYQTLFTYDLDICTVLNNLYRIGLLQGWLKNVMKFSNLKRYCPIEPGHYYIRNLIMEGVTIPAYLRSGDYRVITNHYYGKRKSKSYEWVAHFTADLEIV